MTTNWEEMKYDELIEGLLIQKLSIQKSMEVTKVMYPLVYWKMPEWIDKQRDLNRLDVYIVNAEYTHKYSKNRYVFLSKRTASHGNFFCLKEKKSFPLSYGLMTRCV